MATPKIFISFCVADGDVASTPAPLAISFVGSIGAVFIFFIAFSLSILSISVRPDPYVKHFEGSSTEHVQLKRVHVDARPIPKGNETTLVVLFSDAMVVYCPIDAVSVWLTNSLL